MFPGVTDRGLARQADRRADRAPWRRRPACPSSRSSARAHEWRWSRTASYNRRIHLGHADVHLRPGGRRRPTQDQGRPDRHSSCSAPSPTAIGGITPWGTMLSGEEGGMDVFAGDYTTLPDQELVERQGWDEDENDVYARRPRRTALHVRRRAERMDAVRLGGRDRSVRSRRRKPVKRTALGRFTHEGAQVAVAPDGRVVVFMGDDDDFEYLYRFVTREAVEPRPTARPTRTCSTRARCRSPASTPTATMTWLPLVPGAGAADAGERFCDARPTWCSAPALPPIWSARRRWMRRKASSRIRDRQASTSP